MPQASSCAHTKAGMKNHCFSNSAFLPEGGNFRRSNDCDDKYILKLGRLVFPHQLLFFGSLNLEVLNGGTLPQQKPGPGDMAAGKQPESSQCNRDNCVPSSLHISSQSIFVKGVHGFGGPACQFSLRPGLQGPPGLGEHVVPAVGAQRASSSVWRTSPWCRTDVTSGTWSQGCLGGASNQLFIFFLSGMGRGQKSCSVLWNHVHI